MRERRPRTAVMLSRSCRNRNGKPIVLLRKTRTCHIDSGATRVPASITLFYSRHIVPSRILCFLCRLYISEGHLSFNKLMTSSGVRVLKLS